MNDITGRRLNWTLYSAGLIILIFILQLGRSGQFPQFLDEYFHLQRAWSIGISHGFTTTDTTEYAPVGRANLYPPLYHMALAALHGAGADWITASRISSTIILPLFCLVFFLVLRTVVSPAHAFFFLLLTVSGYGFVNALINNIPATMSLIFWGIAFLLYEKERYLASALILSLCFYTHPLLGYPEFLALFLCALFTRRKYSLWYLVSVFVALPFIFHQVHNRQFFSSLPLGENRFLEIRPIELALGVLGAGLVLFFKEKRPVFILFSTALVIGIVFSIMGGYAYRFFPGQGFLPVLFLAAFVLSFWCMRLPSRRAQAVFAAGAFILFFLLNPSILFNYGRASLKVPDSFFLTSLKYKQRMEGVSIWRPLIYRPAAEMIKATTAKDEIIGSDIDSIAVMFSFLTERPTSNALFREIKPYREIDPISAAKTIIFMKSFSQNENNQVLKTFAKKKYKLLGESPIFFVLRNPALSSSSSIPAGKTIPLPVMWVGFIFLVGAAIADAAWTKMPARDIAVEISEPEKDNRIVDAEFGSYVVIVSDLPGSKEKQKSEPEETPQFRAVSEKNDSGIPAQEGTIPPIKKDELSLDSSETAEKNKEKEASFEGKERKSRPTQQSLFDFVDETWGENSDSHQTNRRRK